LCDGASAALMHAARDHRIAAVIVANPWVRSDSGRAATIVRSHYASRLTSAHFWRRVASGDVRVAAALREALGHLANMWRRPAPGDPGGAAESLPQRVIAALRALDRPVQIHLSGMDLVAAEFDLAAAGDAGVAGPFVTVVRHPEADHTFSRAGQWERVIDADLQFLSAIGVTFSAPGG
jgi:hypothetical protein